MSKTYKADLHCHPLVHKYYPIPAWDEQLDDEDKEAVITMLNFAIARELDVVAITDHNQFSSAIFAKQYAEENELPITVLVGAECSVFVDYEEVHVTALNVKKPFQFDATCYSLSTLIDTVHEHGGLAVLNHPHYYPDIANKILHNRKSRPKFDGVEVYNGVAAANGYPDFNAGSFTGFKSRSSDYHLRFDEHGILIIKTQIKAITYIDETFGNLLEL